MGVSYARIVTAKRFRMHLAVAYAYNHTGIPREPFPRNTRDRPRE